MTELQQQIVQEARKCMGTPHILHGRISGKALDCAGLLIHVGKVVGAVRADFEAVQYNRINNGSELERCCRLFCDEIPVENAEPGDIAIMQVLGNPQHCGFFTDQGLIHCDVKVVEHHIDQQWKDRIVKAFRVRPIG